MATGYTPDSSPDDSMQGVSSSDGGAYNGQDGAGGMEKEFSTFSVDSQGAVHLDHEVRKWVKVDGPTPHTRPTAPYALVSFHARVNAQVYDPRTANNATGGSQTRALPLMDTFGSEPTPAGSPSSPAPAGAAAASASSASSSSPASNKPGNFKKPEPCEDVILGSTKLIRGLEIALRSMAVGEQSDFLMPPEVGHYFGAGELPMRCPLDMDIKLLSCENMHQIPRLPTIDCEVFKVTRTAGPDQAKRVYLGSTVDFLLQRPHDRTGQMTTPQRINIVVGTRSDPFRPLLDLMLMSCAERDIATFMVRRGPNDDAAQQYVLTVLKVQPPAGLGVNVSSAHIARAYSGGDKELLEFSTREYGAALDLGKENDEPAVLRTVDQLHEAGRAAFDQNPVVASWNYAAAAAIVTQKGGPMDEVNKKLARLHGNMGRCAFKLGRFREALALAREAHTFDPNDSKAAFLLAQALRETELFAEAREVLKRVEKMPDAHAPSVADELKLVDGLIASREAQAAAAAAAAAASSSAGSSAQTTPQKA